MSAIARTAQIVDDNLCPATGELKRILTAKSATGTGDDGNLAGKIDGHFPAP